MDKQQILHELGLMARSGEISKEEIMASMGSGEQDSVFRRMSLSEILYYVGGGIVFLGIGVLISQNWDVFSGFVRIFITLGGCLAAFIVAFLLHRYDHLRKVSQAFFLLFGLLAPLGVSILFNEAGFELESAKVQMGVYAILAVWLLSAFWYFRNTILLFFGIVFGTALFHFLVAFTVGDNLLAKDYQKVIQYEFMVIGMAYMFIGYFLTYTSNKALNGVMYGFGSIMFLGTTLLLGGWNPNQNIFWELVYPLLVFGIIFLSIYVKSRAFLVFGTLFLIAYILKITGEYFTEGLGWPTALVLAGLLIMLIGYYAVKINKKYLTTVVMK